MLSEGGNTKKTMKRR